MRQAGAEAAQVTAPETTATPEDLDDRLVERIADALAARPEGMGLCELNEALDTNEGQLANALDELRRLGFIACLDERWTIL